MLLGMGKDNRITHHGDTEALRKTGQQKSGHLPSVFSVSQCLRGELISFRRADFFHRSACSHRPTGGYKRQSVNASQDSEGGYQADPVRHCAHRKCEHKLEESSKEIERILHSSHQVRRDHFHEVGVHGDASYAAG